MGSGKLEYLVSDLEIEGMTITSWLFLSPLPWEPSLLVPISEMGIRHKMEMGPKVGVTAAVVWTGRGPTWGGGLGEKDQNRNLPSRVAPPSLWLPRWAAPDAWPP